jgi:hypothetical protein
MARHRVPVHKIRVVARGTPAELRQLATIYNGKDFSGVNLTGMLPYTSLRRYKNKLIYISSITDLHPSYQWVIELYAHPDFEDVIFEVTTSVTYGRISARVPRRLWWINVPSEKWRSE